MKKNRLLLIMLVGGLFSGLIGGGVADAVTGTSNLNIQPRSIIGTDERIQITDTKAEPYNSMVFVAADGNAGSGAVIGKNTVLTAAHVVRKILENTNKDSIYVIPGRNGSKLPYGKFKIKSVYIPQSYIDHASGDTDIAVITVDTLNNKSIGEVVPVLPIKLSNSVENGVSLATTGFPGDKTWGTMWTAQGKVTGQTNTRVYYDMDTKGGQSGSPVYNEKNEIIAVHTTGGSKNNFGTKINDEYYQFILDHLS
ncbi:trypsin-like serine peptidase [Enterococcus faecium]|uniref:Serine protease n=1 Tax=Enterococcus faecium TaxID=1352 RepID=A0A242BJU9_ENTFC|nr:trypsin-like peptidase domain-containing protein [Enterococcus faecium]EOH55520.1 hypothetical protein UA3_01850 [Enterococcus faecium EnGen0263]OTN95795.1 hypothetical protein A5810_000100 [Enterococcus faecium]